MIIRTAIKITPYGIFCATFLILVFLVCATLKVSADMNRIRLVSEAHAEGAINALLAVPIENLGDIPVKI